MDASKIRSVAAALWEGHWAAFQRASGLPRDSVLLPVWLEGLLFPPWDMDAATHIAAIGSYRRLPTVAADVLRLPVQESEAVRRMCGGRLENAVRLRLAEELVLPQEEEISVEEVADGGATIRLFGARLRVTLRMGPPETEEQTEMQRVKWKVVSFEPMIRMADVPEICVCSRPQRDFLMAWCNERLYSVKEGSSALAILQKIVSRFCLSLKVQIMRTQSLILQQRVLQQAGIIELEFPSMDKLLVRYWKKHRESWFGIEFENGSISLRHSLIDLNLVSLRKDLRTSEKVDVFSLFDAIISVHSHSLIQQLYRTLSSLVDSFASAFEMINSTIPLLRIILFAEFQLNIAVDSLTGLFIIYPEIPTHFRNSLVIEKLARLGNALNNSISDQHASLQSLEISTLIQDLRMNAILWHLSTMADECDVESSLLPSKLLPKNVSQSLSNMEPRCIYLRFPNRRYAFMRLEILNISMPVRIMPSILEFSSTNEAIALPGFCEINPKFLFDVADFDNYRPLLNDPLDFSLFRAGMPSRFSRVANTDKIFLGTEGNIALSTTTLLCIMHKLSTSSISKNSSLRSDHN